MKLSIRNSLISFGVVVASAFLGAFFMQNIVVSHLDLNGVVYHDISVSKKLVADITPPSLLPIEAYALIYEAHFHEEYRSEDLDKIKALEKDYRKAVAEWKTMDLPADEAAKLHNIVLPKVDAFWAAMNNEVIPIIGHGFAEVNPVIDRFVHAYREQRQAVDQLSQNTIAALDEKVASATETMNF